MRRDGGWRSTADQGLLVARWIAGELTAMWLERWSVWAWAIGAVGVGSMALSIPVDPGWPLVALGVLLIGVAVGFRLTLALAVAIVRRVALPRPARHLRGDVAAARARLVDEVVAAGLPVSPTAAARFGWDLFRGRRPHSGVTGRLLDLVGRVDELPEVDRLRRDLADAT